MKANRKNEIFAGIFYILATAAPILTFFFIGFLGGGVAGEPAHDYLTQIAENKTQMIIGSLVELVWVLAVLGIIVNLLPILKKYDETMALGFSGLRLLEAISTVISSIILLSLVTLGQEFSAAGFPESPLFQTTGDLLLASREWAFIIGSGLIWSLSALFLNFLLLKKKLLPQWLSGWGFIGGLLSFIAYSFQIFDVNIGELIHLPIALQEMVFAVWLIVKGFNSSVISPQTASQDEA